MDPAGTASNPAALIAVAFLVFFLSSAIVAGAQTSDAQLVARAAQLSAEQRWQEIVSLVEAVAHPSADLDFQYGTALAQMGRW